MFSVVPTLLLPCKSHMYIFSSHDLSLHLHGNTNFYICVGIPRQTDHFCISPEVILYINSSYCCILLLIPFMLEAYCICLNKIFHTWRYCNSVNMSNDNVSGPRKSWKLDYIFGFKHSQYCSINIIIVLFFNLLI